MPIFTIVIGALQPALLSLLPALIALIGVWVGYKLGMKAYSRQKEHEKIIHRYLDFGIDLMSSNVDHALSIFRENWAHSLRLLKEFRGTAKANLAIRKESYQEKFLKYEPGSFSITPFYKVKSLVGDDIFWEASQLLFAFVGGSYDFFENDLRFMIEEYSENKTQNASPKEIDDKYAKEVWGLHEESQKFYVILKELQNIALLLETEPIGFKDLERLKKSPEIKQSVTSLKKAFSEVLPFNKDKE